MNLKDFISIVPNYPKEGILFKDITPLMQNGKAYSYTTKEIAKYAKERGATIIVGPEARGFIVGCPVSHELEIGFVPVRKPGKLPREVIQYEYDLEYGSNVLCMHRDSIKAGDKVLITDDLLATGGTIEASIKLVEELGGEVVGCAFIVELGYLSGRDKIKKYDIKSLVTYD